MGFIGNWLDRWAERSTRNVAQRSSRRSALNQIGKLMVGSAFILPVLPFDRTGQAHAASARERASPRPSNRASHPAGSGRKPRSSIPASARTPARSNSRKPSRVRTSP